MVTFKHNHGTGQVEISHDGSIKFYVQGDNSLLQTLKSEFSKGVPILQKFRQTGIPGKIRGFRKVQEEADSTMLLKTVQEQHPKFGISFESKENKPHEPRYTLLKWNGQYGAEAIFIVRDNWYKMQSLFTPGRSHDLFWFQSDLANDKSVLAWDEFGDESFDDLEPIAF
jgi:hypothetical protein